MSLFEHRKDDKIYTVRFRADVAQYLHDKMCRQKWFVRKFARAGTASGMIKQSIHTTLDQLLRKLMEAEA